MENSSYGPTPIPSHQHPAAALVAFSQASGLGEALRLSSRPFPQVTILRNLSLLFFSLLFSPFFLAYPCE